VVNFSRVFDKKGSSKILKQTVKTNFE